MKPHPTMIACVIVLALLTLLVATEPEPGESSFLPIRADQPPQERRSQPSAEMTARCPPPLVHAMADIRFID
jgi:hypothetical protein